MKKLDFLNFKFYLWLPLAGPDQMILPALQGPRAGRSPSCCRNGWSPNARQAQSAPGSREPGAPSVDVR